MIETIILVGLFAAGLASVVRALLPVTLLVQKPWSCDLCMSFWCSIIGMGLFGPQAWTFAAAWRHLLAPALAAVAVSLLVLKAIARLRVDGGEG